jgi:uncharacterized protein (DUF58 family)
MRIRATRIVIPFVILGLALLLSSPLLMRLFFLTAILEFIGFIWAFLGVRKMRVVFSDLPVYSRVGDDLTESITVTNDGRLPGLLLEFAEKSDMPGCANMRQLNLKPKSSLSWETTVHCSKRGLYRLGSATVTAGDPLGIFSRKQVFGKPHSLLVYPSTVELPYFEVSSSGMLGDVSSGLLSGQTGTNAAGVREYLNGDSLMHIHWPSTARNGRLMVKMFDGGRASSTSDAVYVLVDMEKGVYPGTGDDSSEEYAVKAAASLVRKYIEEGLHVGLILSSNPIVAIAPDRGDEHYYRLLEALALTKSTGIEPIHRVISEYLKTISGDATAVIVTPATTTNLVDSVRQLRGKEILVSVVSVDTASFGGIESSSNITRHLRWLGIQVYVARKGEDMGTSLDRRTMPSTLHYI